MIATHTKLVDEARKHKFQGGEGTLLLNTAPEGYWSETLFARDGRPWPPHYPTLAFLVYVCVVTTCAGTMREYTGTSLPLDSFSLSAVSSCLFFLLVFRSNAAYQRWWEGRQLWGSLINRTRDLARQSIAYIGDEAHVDTMIKYTIAFAVTTKRHLRLERELPELVETGVLTPEQVAEVQAAQHMPLLVLEKLSATIRSARKAALLSDIEAMALDANLTKFEDDLGACERILKTKMPFAYLVHLRTFMIVWLLVLPFVLIDKMGWGTIPFSLAIFQAVVGVEMIGVEIENPFGHDYNDLPLDNITNETIANNLLALLKRHKPSNRRPKEAYPVSALFQPGLLTS
jgi:putative membrane protein